MATYLEGYQQHLEQRLALGGTPKEMEACLTEYNQVGDPAWGSSTGFEAWAKKMPFQCVDCRRPFNVAPEQQMLPHDVTRCPECHGKA